MDSHRPNDSHQPSHPAHLMTALPKNDVQSSVESSHKFRSAATTQEHAFLVLPKNDVQSQKSVESSHKFPSAAATQKEHAFLVLPKNDVQSQKPVESSHKFPSAAATQKERAFLVLPKNDAQSQKSVESSHKFPSVAATQEHAFLVLPKNDVLSQKSVESSYKFPSADATQKKHASCHKSTTPTEEYFSSSGDELEYSRSRDDLKLLRFSFEALSVSGPCCRCPLIVTSTCNCGHTTRSVPCGAEIFCPPPTCDLLCKKPPSCHHSAGRDPHNCHFGACPPCKELCGKKLADCIHFCAASCHEAIVTKVRDTRCCSGPLEGNLTVVTLPCPPCTLHKSKDPISRLNDRGAKNGYLPCYKVTAIPGPSNKRTFTFEVTAEGWVAEGRGTTKQKAKHAAAAVLLQTLPPLDTLPPAKKRKSKDPISRLNDRGAKNGYLPCYKVTAIPGPSNKRTFTFEVTAEGWVAEGRGTTKQKAKHAAAAVLLQTLPPLDTLPPAKKRKIGTEYDAHTESDVDANDNFALPKGSAHELHCHLCRISNK